MLVSLVPNCALSVEFVHDPVPSPADALTWSGAVLHIYLTKSGVAAIGPVPVVPGGSTTQRYTAAQVKSFGTLSISVDFVEKGTGTLRVMQEGKATREYKVSDDRLFLGGVL